MGYEIWIRLRRYLLIWLLIGIGVLVCACVSRWELISAYFALSAQSAVVCVTIAVTIIGLLISILFPRR